MAEVPARREIGALMQTEAKRKLKGLETFTPAQLGLNPPELRIIHSVRGRNDLGKPGQLRFGKECLDEVSVVFLRAHPLRILREGEENSTVVTCASIDGQVPHPSVIHPKSSVCRGCDYAQWTDGPSGGRRIAPPCGESIAFLGVRPDAQDAPFWFIAKSSAAKAAKEFLSDVNGDQEVNALAECRVVLTTEEKRNGGVIWYVPIFTVRKPLIPFKKYEALVAAVEEVFYIPTVQDQPEGDVVDATATAVPEGGDWDVGV